MTLYNGQNNPPEDSVIESIVGSKPGRYIDIGAGEPRKHSNTRYFYDLGWIGLAIEPCPFYWDKWKEERPEDILIKAAITDYDGECEMAATATVGSFIGDDYKYNRNKELYQSPCMTLKTLMTIYPEYIDCDFVSIDIETNEDKLFSTWNYELLHPKLFVIEGEMRNVDYSHKWEKPLLSYYDRINKVANNIFYKRVA